MLMKGFQNFQVKKNCIAKENDMHFHGEGRKIYNKTKIRIKNWESVSNSDVFKKCIECAENSCPIDCCNISLILNVK